jgi:carboxypeptidase Q
LPSQLIYKPVAKKNNHKNLQGINDNGSGTIGLLEVLLKLKDFKTFVSSSQFLLCFYFPLSKNLIIPSNNAIRFCWFSAEEFGLLGAEKYVSQLSAKENLKIAMYLNFDMIASPNYILGVYDGDGSAFGLSGPPGSAQIESVFEGYFRDVGKRSVPTAFTGRSDYGPFLEVNIPSGGLFTGAEGIKTKSEAQLFGGEIGAPYDVNYHQPGDVVGNLNVEALIENTKAISHIVAIYGRSLDGFPKRELPNPQGARASWESLWSEGSHGKFNNGSDDSLY